MDFIWGSVPTSRKRPSWGYSFTQLSRSSPVRTKGSLIDTLECYKHRPSTEEIKNPVPFMRIIRVHPAVACYSTKPPSTPLYLMPISSSYNTGNKCNTLEHQQQQLSKIKVTSKNSKKIVKKVLRSILNSVMDTVTNEFTRSNFETPATQSNKQEHYDVAIQTEALNSENRYCKSLNEDCSSSEEGAREGHDASERSWAGEVRALRDSHVRLVLRQLRQLRDIDRLDRALNRPPPTPTYPPNHNS